MVRSVVKKMLWGSTRAIVVAFVMALAALALLAPSSQARGKPDLVVTSAQLTSRNYVFLGEQSTYSFKDTTKNHGSSTAGRSYTSLVLNETLAFPTGGSGDGHEFAARAVPRLKPDHSDKGSKSSTFTLSDPTFIGTYYAFVCADRDKTIAESREGNNCKNTNERLSIIPKTWKGTVSGSASVVDGVTESWTAQDMTFKFDSYSAPYFQYMASGDVSYSISGTDDQGCTWSGSGTATIGNGGSLAVHVYFVDYDGGAVITDPVYTITRSCPNGSEGEIEGPWNSTWFFTGQPTIPDDVGVTELAGNYTTSDGGVHWEWNLQAE
jgi:CARDB